MFRTETICLFSPTVPQIKLRQVSFVLVFLMQLFTVAEPLLENELAHMQGLTVIHSDVFCPVLRRDVSLSLVTTKKNDRLQAFARVHISLWASWRSCLEVSTWGMPRHITGWHCFHFLLSWTPSAGSTGFVLCRLRALEKAGALREPRASLNSVPARKHQSWGRWSYRPDSSVCSGWQICAVLVMGYYSPEECLLKHSN